MIFKDPDCKRLASSTKVAIRTYTTDKINIVGSCGLFAIHPDTSKIKQVTFYVTSHEGSVVLSCKTSLRLNLIHPHSNLDQIPHCASLIYSNADHPMKRKPKKSAKEKYVNQCVKEKVPIQDVISKWECQANVYIEDDKNRQATKCYKKNNSVYSDKNCQESPNVHMWPVKPAQESNHMQSVTRSSNIKPEMKKNQVVCSQYQDQQCQNPVTRKGMK